MLTQYCELLRLTPLLLLALVNSSVRAQQPCHPLSNPLAVLLPGNTDTRLENAFEHQPLMGTDPSNNTLALLAGQDPWISQFLAIHSDRNLTHALNGFPTAAVGWHDADGESVAPPVDEANISQLLRSRHSVVVKREMLREPESCLQQSLQQQLLTEVTAHLYVSGGEAQALKVCLLVQQTLTASAICDRI